MNEPMSRHTSWRAGGAAERCYLPADLADLASFLRATPPQEPLYFVGLGSNLLVRDGGVRGTVVLTHRALSGMRLESEGAAAATLYAEAGVAGAKVARFCARHDLEGAEFLAGIPGTVGGALAMNAGCFGGETWQIVERVQTLDREGVLRERTPADYEVRYRHVALRERAPQPSAPGPREEWFVAAWFRLRRGDGALARARIKGLLERRIATQPLELPNAGSVFRNPAGTYAAVLIEGCGLKGFAIGAAQVSTKHANFIVNTGGATAADIEAVIETVERSVLERTGIRLEREVRVIGEA